MGKKDPLRKKKRLLEKNLPLFFLKGLFFLASCAPLSQKTPLSLPTPQTFSLNSAIENQKTSSFSTQAPWPTHWWEIFQDPLLASFIQKAYKEHPSMKKAQARLQYALHAMEGASAPLFPQVELTTGMTEEHLSRRGVQRSLSPRMPSTLHPITFNLNGSYEGDFWNKNRSLFQAAIGKAHAVEEEKQHSALLLGIATAQSYFSLLAYQAQEEIVEKQLFLLRSFETLMEKRQKKGLENRSALLSIQGEVLKKENQSLHIKQHVALIRQVLESFINTPVKGISTLASGKSRLPLLFPLPAEFSSELLLQRPDLKAELYYLQSAALEVKAAQADLCPRFNLSALVGLESLQITQLFSSSSKTAVLQPMIHLPLFTAKSLRAALKAKSAYFDAVFHAYEESLLHALLEVANCLTLLQKVQEKLSLQKDRLQNQTAQYHLMQTRFTQGLVDTLSLLHEEIALLDEELIQVDLEHAYASTVLSLIKSIGGNVQKPNDSFQPHDR